MFRELRSNSAFSVSKHCDISTTGTVNYKACIQSKGTIFDKSISAGDDV